MLSKLTNRRTKQTKPHATSFHTSSKFAIFFASWCYYALLLLLWCIIIMRFQIEIGATTTAATTRTLAQVDGSHVCDLTFDNIWMVSKRQAARERQRESKRERRAGWRRPSTFGIQFAFFLFFFRGYYSKLSRSGVYRDLMYVKVTCALKSCLI